MQPETNKTKIKKAYYTKTDLVLGKDLEGRFIFREDAEAKLIREVRELKTEGYTLKSIIIKLTGKN
jgi:hypothetical protein